MGSRRDCTWILGLVGFRVVTMESDASADSRLTIRIERRGCAATRAAAVAAGRAACDRRGIGRGTICRGRRIP